MTSKEYIMLLNEHKNDSITVKKIEKKYGTTLPNIIKRIISCSDETVFLDNDYRILSVNEVENAENDLHVNFKEKGIIPIVDCGDNDFIVYHFNDDFWSKFNIIDEIIFKKKESFEDMLD